MADRVRIGTIGTGQIGNHHLEAYSKIPEAQVVAVCDINKVAAQAAADKYGIKDVYTDYHEMLKRDDITSIDVCLHNRFHMQTTIDALNAGKNVYCEKPMSWNYGAAKTMLAAAKRTGRMLHIQLATIYAAEARAAKRMIDEGQLGQIYYAKSSHYRRRGRPWVDGYGTAFFVQKEAAGGGALVDIAVYHIARMMWLLGNPAVETVSGKTYQMLDNMYPDRRASGPYGVEEFGMGLVRLAGGLTYFIEEAWAIQADHSDGDRVFGSKAGLRVEPFGYFTTLSDMEMDATFDVKQADWRWHQCNPLEAGFDESQRHWVWAQLGRVPLIDTAGLALKTALITEGIYLSSHLGREVTVDEIEETTPDYRLGQ